MGVRAYRACGEEVVNSMIKVTANSDPDDIQAIYDEVDVF